MRVMRTSTARYDELEKHFLTQSLTSQDAPQRMRTRAQESPFPLSHRCYSWHSSQSTAIRQDSPSNTLLSQMHSRRWRGKSGTRPALVQSGSCLPREQKKRMQMAQIDGIGEAQCFPLHIYTTFSITNRTTSLSTPVILQGRNPGGLTCHEGHEAPTTLSKSTHQ